MRMVEPTTFRRFWMEAGTPTPKMPATISFVTCRSLQMSMQTKVLPFFTRARIRK